MNLINGLVFLFFASLAHAEFYQPLDAQIEMPSFQAWDESGNILNLKTLASQSDTKVTFLFPGFTSCKMSCPLIASNLSRVIKNSFKIDAKTTRVIFFSFDPEETSETLSSFKSKNHLPETWTVLRADQKTSDDLLKLFNFEVMQTKLGFDHPAQIFIFNHQGKWTASIYGANFTQGEVEEAYQVAVNRTGTPVSEFASSSRSPSVIIGFSFLVLLASIGIIFYQVFRRNRLSQS